MGTGMVSTLLYTLPYNTPAVQNVGIAVFILNILLFVLITGCSVLRYAMYPTLWTLLIRHPVQSLFWSSLPMGLATIINMFVDVCVEGLGWGVWAQRVAFGLWWVDVFLSVACCFVLPFLMIHIHPWSLESMTAAWLLPVAAPIVTASTGATVANILSDKQHALMTVLVSYTLWGFGLPMAMLTLVIYFHRLAVHKLPPREVIVSVFLPLGPLGQGGFSLMNLGKVSMKLLPETGTLHPLAGDVLYILGLIVAMVLWAFGLLWLFFAIASISRSRFPFNVGCWGVLFPTGVYALSTMQIGNELPSAFFRIFGMIIAAAIVLLWVLISITTIKRATKGDIFYSPALHDYQKLCPHAQTEEKAEKSQD
ncbi:C4-dicarboxylate transporter/malic acid transport protein [Saccharata proteae CBS 121410]|uniref:Sulfite efflux pump SSU1 n=1 Tax=Saccharata proteae CBS 121410 TaxID=1314787 RepID=A0A9P4HW50_9PEZI|nr:C4-dicarboxylate transporter/malic acid transport protein [Saccharata proteae CBS 121410]